MSATTPPYQGLSDAPNRQSLATTTFLSGFKQHRSNQIMQNVAVDTAATAAAETWTNTNAWFPTTAATVSNGAAFAPSTSNTQPMTRTGWTVGPNETAVLECLINVVSGSAKNLLIGFSTDASGATPATGLGNVAVAVGPVGSNFAIASLGTSTAMLLPGPAAAGLYKVTVEIGPLFLTYTITKAGGNFLSSWWAPGNTGTPTPISRSAAALVGKTLIPWVLLGDTTGGAGSSIQQMSFKKGPASSPAYLGIASAANTNRWTQFALSGRNVGHSGVAMAMVPQGYDFRKPYPAVLCFHSSGGLLDDYLTATQKQPLTTALLAAGFIVIMAASLSGYSLWGNQNEIDCYTAAAAWARDNFNIGPICFLGTSMGGIESLLTLAEKRVPDVVAWVGISPTYDQMNCYFNGVGGGFPPLQTAAYNATYESLQAAAMAGAVSIQTANSYTAGTRLAIDANLLSGALGEIVITTGPSTGSSAPYTTPITALKYAHISGAMVSNFPTQMILNNALSSPAPDGLPVHDPAQLPPSAFRGMPMYVFTAPDDTLVQPAGNGYALVQAMQGNAAEILQYPVPSGTGGHGFTLNADIIASIVGFFLKYTCFG